MRLMIAAYCIFCLIFVMAGCTTVATSGASALYNRRSIEKNVNDEYITFRSYQAIDIESNHFKDANVNVATFNHMVLLSGQVPTEEQKTEAADIISDIEGIDRIYNWITVEKPVSHLARMKDAWLTAKIKAKLIASNELDASQVKVVTENRRVFLMGTLRPSEARAAVQAASTTAGVQEVVKLFLYLNLSDTPLDG